VRAAYVGALLALQNLQNAREAEAIGERVFESARARLEAGAGTDVDRNLAEVERGRLTQARVSALLGVGESLDRLRRAAGIAQGRPIALTSTLALPSPVDQTLEALLERARQRRLELKALEASARQIDATIVRLRRERVPSPTLFFDVMSQQPGQLYLGGGLGLPIPVWRRNQGELAIASAQRALVDEDRAVFEEQLAIEVEQAQRVAGGLRETVTRWQESAMPAAERNLELVTQGWRAGKFDLFRVVPTSREAAEARRRRLELIGALRDATITLQRAIGEAL
jgi:cobalt-zinc-cadmium efflux system outer membrane protein